MKTLFSECPILIFELNKIMPKNNKLPLLNQNNSDEFLEKLKNKDEAIYKEFIKLLIKYRDENLSIEVLANKAEEILGKYPELLEEAMLFIDYKKLNTFNFRKNIINKNNIINNTNNNQNNNYQNVAENNQSSTKKENRQQNQNLIQTTNNEKHQINKYHYHQYISHLPPKLHTSPDYMFLNGLKTFVSPEV